MPYGFEIPEGLSEAIRQSQNLLTPEMMALLESSRPTAAELAMAREMAQAAEHQLELLRASGIGRIAREMAAEHSRLVAVHAEPLRVIQANFSELAKDWGLYGDLASRSLTADLLALSTHPVGERFHLRPSGAAVLGLRTASLISKSVGTTGLPRTSAALQARAVRTLTTNEPSSAPGLVEEAQAEVEDRLQGTLRAQGLTDALETLSGLRSYTPVALAKGRDVERRGWIVGYRTLIEDLAKRATPKIPPRKQLLVRRFDVLKRSGHPQAVTIDKDWSALESLLNSLHGPAHELRVTADEAVLTTISVRAEWFLLILAEILSSRINHQ